MKLLCEWCEKEYEAKSRRRKFCSPECHYKHASKKYNPTGYHKRPDLSEMNKKLNPTRMNNDTRSKLCLLRLGSGRGTGYIKLNGRHLHRTIAEAKLGRKLMKNEIVHHIDGDKRNNSLDNLQVLSSQSEHAHLHFGGGSNGE